MRNTMLSIILLISVLIFGALMFGIGYRQNPAEPERVIYEVREDTRPRVSFGFGFGGGGWGRHRRGWW